MWIRQLIFCGLVAGALFACGGSAAPSDVSTNGELVDVAPEPRPNPTGLLPLPEYGFQITVGPFTVGPGEEMTRCSFVTLPLEETSAFYRIETAMATGSHHMNMYLAFAPIDKEGTTECGSDTMGQLIAFGAQLPYHDVVLPNGIGYPVAKNQQIILEAHYLNPTLEPVEGLGVVNIHMEKEGQKIEDLVGIMALFPDEIFVPPNDYAVSKTRCVVPFDAELVILMSHMHRFGQYFDAYLVDTSTTPETKELIYLNEDWHVPDYTVFDPEVFIPVKKGDVLEFACHYENFTDQPVTNGSSGETDEMCIFGAAYVPYHGILLCQPEGTTCPDNPIRESVDPNSSLCAHYMDCMGRCGGLNIPCNNCCTPAMHPDCMMCMQGLLGCAMQKGCSTGYANFDLGCISEHCGELFAECFLTPLDP